MKRGKNVVFFCVLHGSFRFEKLAILEFDRERKSMSVLVRAIDDAHNGSQSSTLLVKGAAELVIERCTSVMQEDGTVQPLDADLRKALITASDKMADEALRCLVLAQKVIHSCFWRSSNTFRCSKMEN